VVAGGVALPLLAVLLLLALLATETGTRWAVSLAAQAMPGLRAGAVDGALLDRLTLRDLSLADAEGPWLTAAELTLDWRPRALLSGRLVIDDLAGRAIEMSRLPASSPAAEEPPAATDDADGGGFDPRWLGRVALRGLDIDRLSLGAPVLGTAEAVVLTAQGAAGSGADGGLAGHFAVERLDAPGELRLDYVLGPGGPLSLDAVAFEPAGGPLGALLGLPERSAIRLALNGEGPADAWDGRLLAEAETVATLEADLSLRLGAGRPGRILARLDGDLSAGPAAPAALAVLARPRIHLGLQATRRGDVIQVDDLTLGSDGWSVTGRARLASGDLGGQVTATVETTAGHPDTVVTALTGLPLGTARLTADLGGRLDKPHVAATVTAGDTVVRSLRAVVSARLDEALAFTLGGHLEGAGDSLPALAPLLGPGLEVTARGSMALDGSRLTLAALTVDGAALQAVGQGRVLLRPLDIAATMEATLRDLAVFEPLAGLPLRGHGRLGLRLAMGGDGRAEGPLTLTLDDLALGLPTADRLIGGHVDLHTGVVLGADALSLRDLALTTPGLSAAGQARLAGWTALDGRLSLAVPRLAVLEAGLTGAAAVEATLGGTLAAPAITGTARLPDGSAQGVALSGLAASLALTAERLTVADLAGRVGGAPVGGGATIDFASGLIDGRLGLDLSGARLEPYGVAFEGAAQATLELTPEAAGQGVSLALDGQRMAVASAGLGARAITVEATLHDAFGAARGSFALRLGAGAVSGLAFERAALTGTLAEATVVTGRLTVDGAGKAGEAPLAVTLAAAADLASDPLALRLSVLEMRGNGHALSLTAPTTLTVGDAGALSLAPARLVVDGAGVEMSADLGPRRLAVDLSAAALPLAALRMVRPDFPAEGHLAVAVSLSGPPTDPRGTIALRTDDLSVPDAAVEGLGLTVDGTVGGGMLGLEARMAGVGPEPGRLRARLPLAFAASGLPSLAADRPMEARVTWRGPVGAVWALVPQVGHRLAGQAMLDARVEGTLDAPRFSGQGRLTDGVYESLEFGTVLRQVTVAADLTPRGDVDLTLSASDGGSGKMSGAGHLVAGSGSGGAGTEDGGQLTASLSLEHMTLVRRDDLTATLGGTLDYAGTLAKGLLSGNLRSQRAEVRLDGGLGGGVPHLEVAEVNRDALAEGAGRPAPPPGGEENGGLGAEIALRIAVDVPNQVFVRGRGLDSEWQGRAVIRGTFADPRIVGQLRVVRGTYDVIGKSFVLERGVIDLRGGEQVDPGLDVRAVHDTGDLTAVVLVSGTASRPTLALESRPVLPRDEVLSRVLFGRGVADLGPAQAVGVARAASQLAGGGGGGGALDITTQLRSGLGLDVFAFGGGQDGPSIEAGKYLAEDVYVGVEQGATAESGSVNIEVELTPRVSVKSKTTGTGESDLGVEWKFDY
jgi:translocation and assembly module TamB